MSANPQNMNNKDFAPWLAILAVASLVFIWFVAHTQISTVVMWVRYVQAHMLVFDPVGQRAMAEWLGSTTASEATVKGLYQSGAVAGWSLRWLSLGFLLVWFGWLVYKSPARTGRYSNRYTMKTLAEQEAGQWPVLTQVLGLDLDNVPLDDPINGMRKNGQAYARQHGLLHPLWTDPSTLKGGDGTLSQVDRLADGRLVDITRARALFASQLGRPWQGVEALLPYEKALFGAFVAQMEADPEGKDKDLSLQIINELALASRAAFEKKDPSLLDSPSAALAIERYSNAPAIQKRMRGHHYVRTVLMALLDKKNKGAREYGVMPTAWFRWLKMADRRTWYALNDLGLDVASAEAAGIRAHYLAERVARTAIAEPQIEPAIKGLIEYLNTYLDEEAEES